MKLGEAASILASELTASLKYEYYSSLERAELVAKALSKVSGQWAVRKDSSMPACYWIVRID